MNNTAISFEKTLTIGGDLNVNRLGYGAMRITGKGIWGPPKDEGESGTTIVSRAIADRIESSGDSRIAVEVIQAVRRMEAGGHAESSIA